MVMIVQIMITQSRILKICRRENMKLNKNKIAFHVGLPFHLCGNYFQVWGTTDPQKLHMLTEIIPLNQRRNHSPSSA